MTATDVIAEHERRIREDPEFRAHIEQAASEREDRRRRNREAEQPVLRDLASAGIVVTSVWDLYKFPDVMPLAIPILIDHLGREHPDAVLDGIGTTLASKASRPWWAELKAIYLAT